MPLFLFLILSSCFSSVLAIIQTCATDTDCAITSANSICQSSFCQCLSTFILDCNTPADYLTSNYQTLRLDNTTQYWQTMANKPNTYYDFMFQVCGSLPTIPNYNLVFDLWINSGAAQLSQQNFVGSVNLDLTSLANMGQCIDFVQYQIQLQTQPNGQPQNLIVGLSIQPQSGSAEVLNATTTIDMKVTITALFSSDLLLKLAIGIVSAVAVIVLIVVIVCCYRKWKKKKTEQQKMTYRQQMLEQFKAQTPQVLAKNIRIPTMTTCSICLGQFQPEQKVRKLVCRHIFHSECIDGWCMKNLTCPICRLQLDIESINKKKKQMQHQQYNWHQNSLSMRQDLLDIELQER